MILAEPRSPTRQAAEQALRCSEKRYRTLADASFELIWTRDAAGNVVEDLPSWRAFTGQSVKEIQADGWAQAIHPEDRGRVLGVWRRAIATQAPYNIEYRLRRHDGEYRCMAAHGVPVRGDDGTIREWIGACRDATDEKSAEERRLREERRSRSLIERKVAAIATLSRGMKVVAHAVSEPELLQEMCRVVVEGNEYLMAWVGAVENDAGRSVKPVAWAGEVGTYLENARITWADEPRGRGPTGRAVRTGKPQVTQDVRADPRMAPWLEEATRRGFASSVALPLKDEGGVFAVLMIYAGERDFFDAEALKLLQQLADSLAFGIRVLRDRAEREKATQRWEASLQGTVSAIASTVEMRDLYTAGHQQRVARLAAAIARELNLPESRIQGLYLAGVIHDVGKITVPAEILSKPAKLSEPEYQLVQTHAQAGRDIIKDIDFPWPLAAIVVQHHERHDGSGYPQGLSGEAILLEARILGVADVVDAMMSHRPYRPALGVEVALAEIENGMGRLYDPAVADSCLTLFREKGFGFPLRPTLWPPFPRGGAAGDAIALQSPTAGSGAEV